MVPKFTDNPPWCIVHGLSCKAAAPTGIAAANVEVEGTDVTATTLHALLELDGELKTKLDLAKLDHAKVAALMKLQVSQEPQGEALEGRWALRTPRTS